MVAAAVKRGFCRDLVVMLMGRDPTIKVTELVMTAAAENWIWGKTVMVPEPMTSQLSEHGGNCDREWHLQQRNHYGTARMGSGKE